MRKLVPIVLSSLVAMAGTAFAADTTGSPTATANTDNPSGQSYSDKSNTSPGTNAIMDEKSKATAEKKAAKKQRKSQAAATPMDTTSDTPMSTTTSPAVVPPVGNSNASTVNSTTGKSGQ
jgi:hypothetical protein